MECFVAADLFEFDFLQHAEQFDLHSGAGGTDFVEKNRPAVGLYELAEFVAHAPVKAPATWPKSSLSKSVSGNAPQAISTNGLSRRELRR